MRTSISILDNDYREWVKTLATRYKNSQIKAAVKVNSEKLFFNWLLGRDIVEMHVEERWGESVIMQLSKDLRLELSGVEGLSKSNIYYCKKFYLLYNQCNEFFQQLVGKIESTSLDNALLTTESKDNANFQQWAKREIHRPSLLPFESQMLYRHRSQNGRIRLSGCRSIGRICGIGESYLKTR